MFSNVCSVCVYYGYKPRRWWSLAGSNRWPQHCQCCALPAELRPHTRGIKCLGYNCCDLMEAYYRHLRLDCKSLFTRLGRKRLFLINHFHSFFECTLEGLVFLIPALSFLLWKTTQKLDCVAYARPAHVWAKDFHGIKYGHRISRTRNHHKQGRK